MIKSGIVLQGASPAFNIKEEYITMKYEIPWKEAVARIILEILEHRDYLKRRMFTGEDLADSYKRFRKKFL